ncbi:MULTISPECIES: YopX family protein [Paenibacillus]|uniref:YopX family protein n=1 Tax=Paenibacillus TaxID=44249 RepID=UPI00096BF97C|nr:YopX family protein [Paenibacillus peoriae]OMF79859.1 hypothetical protein BK145_12970 [Paenibacillus peoriae]
MRDIKFRGKRLDNGEWAFGDIWQHNGRVDIVDHRAKSHPVDPETVGQYVNYYGIEFYNSDIMLIACDCDSEYGCTHNDGIYTVVWNKETAGYALKSQSNGRLYPLDEYGEENMHVAGNIHDNPELLQPQGENKLG